MAATVNQQSGLGNTSRGAGIINSVHTDVVITEFNNKTLVVITQFEKLGSLILVTKDVAQDDNQQNHVFNTSSLFGKDEPELHVVARMLAEKMNSSKPILFSLALKDTAPAMIKAVVELVLHLRVKPPLVT